MRFTSGCDISLPALSNEHKEARIVCVASLVRGMSSLVKTVVPGGD